MLLLLHFLNDNGNFFMNLCKQQEDMGHNG